MLIYWINNMIMMLMLMIMMNSCFTHTENNFAKSWISRRQNRMSLFLYLKEYWNLFLNEVGSKFSMLLLHDLLRRKLSLKIKEDIPKLFCHFIKKPLRIDLWQWSFFARKKIFVETFSLFLRRSLKIIFKWRRGFLWIGKKREGISEFIMIVIWTYTILYKSYYLYRLIRFT